MSASIDGGSEASESLSSKSDTNGTETAPKVGKKRGKRGFSRHDSNTSQSAESPLVCNIIIGF